MNNPLIQSSSSEQTLPEFSKIKPHHVKPAVEQAISNCKKVISQVLADNSVFTWDNLVLPIDEIDDVLSKLWSPVSHMNSVVSSDELREAYESCLPLLSEYGTFVGQHEALYQAYLTLHNSDEFVSLDVAQQKVITNALRDFKLSGIALSDEDKKRYGEISTRLSELSSNFSNNVLDATHAFSITIADKAELTGLPESALAAAKELATSKDNNGYTFTLDIPSYLPVMMYCDNASLREKLYTAFVTRASDQGPNANEFDNSNIMNELLSLRHELAGLLDFDNYAQHSLATKMANSTSEVMEFLENLALKSQLPRQTRLPRNSPTLLLVSFLSMNLQAWDLAYYSEKVKAKPLCYF